MKKLFLITCVNSLIVINCFSQAPGKTDYLKKSKDQKIAAWVLLGTGVVLDIIGIATYPDEILFLTESQKQQEKTAGVLAVTGIAFMLTSIPFFISAHKNKKRAMSITINTQQFRQLKSSNLYTVNYPALTMKIRL